MSPAPVRICIYDLERLPDVFRFSGRIYMSDTILNPLTIYQKWIFQIIIFHLEKRGPQGMELTFVKTGFG